ncbi:MAG: hypothetical protein H6621_09820 [Halobacteriovoraceae bacterium]|nr:hypothetical protein [Halobacteriovoraceae bacterium]MCB9095354.1 hypothetical protein [Halobacteriovoraceae bacterium]
MKANIVLMLLLSLLMACKGGDSGSADDINNELDDSFNTDPESSGSTQNGLCYVDQYAPDKDSITRKLDIIIVPDTSTSLKEERGDIASGFDFFLKTIPESVDYRIGVILAHSGKSPKSGRLFQRNIEPFVLDSQLMTTQETIDALYEKIKSPAGDGFSDGGEMGLYSLGTALDENLIEIQDQGLFREDAALLVVFVADEQDICFEYPEHIQPVIDPQKKEEKAKAKFCYDENNNLTVSPQIVLDKIKSVKGSKPLVLGAVIYNNQETMPINGENEIGYGYKEIVELAGGITVDLASGDYGDGLERLGNLATASIEAKNIFNLKISNVDKDSIQVTVDGLNVGYSYLSDMNQIQLDEERDPLSVARIEYCQKKESPLIATKVITGGFHTCVLYKEGNVRCFGQNNYGQLGLGHTNNIGDNEPITSQDFLPIDEKVIDLSAGLNHTCAVLESGRVLCFGANQAGQLGLGHTDNIGDDESLTSDLKIDLGEPAVRIYSGTNYNCALLASKKVKCWGENNSGQLGLGHTANIGDDETSDQFAYTNIGNSVLQMDISTISNHSCAALIDGSVKCWGNNNFGQLGYGHTDNIGDDEFVADEPALSFSSKVLQLATGFLHTCAITEGQKIHCWGYNAIGQLGSGVNEILGDNEDVSQLSPVALSEELPMKTVATGNNHTCSIGVDHKVYCWGLGVAGALGHGNKINIGDDEVATLSNSLVNIEAQEFSQINGGVNHTCALERHEGKVICWGANNAGQLGLGHTKTIGDNEIPSVFVELK